METQMNMDKHINKHLFLLVYFSGTGGVKRIADAFETQLKKKNMSVFKHSLDLSEINSIRVTYPQIISNTEVVILLYPVHGFNAPVPVFEWIEMLPYVTSLPVAVISVSGGGEVSLNKASRVQCIKALENKGYKVFYEKMMIMPSNWWIPTHDHLAIRLLRCIPEKSEQIVNRIISGEKRRAKPVFPARITASIISKFEKAGMKKFGKGLRITEECTGCEWCVINCPRENIQMINGMPQFGEKCMMCFRCIYGCPKNAIQATTGKFMVIKQGFSLKNLEKRMAGVELEPVGKLAKGLLWKGVVDYLLNND